MGLVRQGGSSNPKGGAGKEEKGKEGNRKGDPVAAEDESDRRLDESSVQGISG
jgi:hypothetical protein